MLFPARSSMISVAWKSVLKVWSTLNVTSLSVTSLSGVRIIWADWATTWKLIDSVALLPKMSLTVSDSVWRPSPNADRGALIDMEPSELVAECISTGIDSVLSRNSLTPELRVASMLTVVLAVPISAWNTGSSVVSCPSVKSVSFRYMASISGADASVMMFCWSMSPTSISLV